MWSVIANGAGRANDGAKEHPSLYPIFRIKGTTFDEEGVRRRASKRCPLLTKSWIRWSRQ